MLSKEASTTIFWVFGMTRPKIDPRSPGPWVNSLLARPVDWYTNIHIDILTDFGKKINWSYWLSYLALSQSITHLFFKFYFCLLFFYRSRKWISDTFYNPFMLDFLFLLHGFWYVLLQIWKKVSTFPFRWYAF